MALRFLLDQGFPKPQWEMSDLDASIAYTHLSDEAPELSRSSTPDWLVYLVAAARGYDGVVTSDRAQLTQDVELIALTLTSLSIVTWRRGDNDPITRWAQLLIYMRDIRRRIADGQGNSIFLIPNAALPAGNVEKASDLARRKEAEDRVSFSERRTAALAIMRAEVAQRRLAEVSAYLP